MRNDQILLGVELEMEYEDGSTKLTKELENILDYVVGSAHNQPCSFLKLPDITQDEIGEFFESFRKVLVNSFRKNPINIWGHPFSNEFGNFGDKYWKAYMLPIYYECLDICASKQIAIELTPSYHKKCEKFPGLSGVLDEMYSIAMKNKEIMFVTSSDAHSLARLGDISIPLDYIKKFNIPDSRILELYKKN